MQKLANLSLLRLFRNTPYNTLVRAYPSQIGQLTAITETEEKEKHFENVSHQQPRNMSIQLNPVLLSRTKT